MVGSREGKQCLFLTHTLGEPGFLDGQALREASFLASMRLQLLPAIMASQRLGIQNRVLAIRTEKPELLERIKRPEICIVGKISHPDKGHRERMAMANIAAIYRLKRQGTRIIVLYSDNLAASNDSSRRELGLDLLDLADRVITPCKSMAEVVEATTGTKGMCTVIEDPWQVEKAPFKAIREGEPVRIGWFGHQSNARFMVDCFSHVQQAVKETKKSIQLSLLSSPDGLQMLCDHLDNSAVDSSLEIEYATWEHDTLPSKQLSRFLEKTHICLLPSDPSDPGKQGASHNRAVDSIRAGCITIGSPLQSYTELQNIMLVGRDFKGMLEAAISSYDSLVNTASKRRDSALERFSPASNHQKWMSSILNELEIAATVKQP